MIRNVKVLFALVLTMVGLTLVTATPAQAATSGCGAACDYENPDDFYAFVDGTYAFCAYDPGVRTIDVKYSQYNWASNDYVELRYSPRCRTVWARFRASTYQQDVILYSYYSNGNIRAWTKYSDVWWSQSWTAMLNDAGYQGKACLIEYTQYEEFGTGSPYITHGCTKKY